MLLSEKQSPTQAVSRLNSQYNKRFMVNKSVILMFCCKKERCRSCDSTSQTHFRQSFESSPESRGSQTSGVLPVLFVQAKSTKNVPFAGSSEVLQTSNQHTAAAASDRNIKTFARKLRGFANLESAHKDNNFVQTKLNPSAALGGIVLPLCGLFFACGGNHLDKLRKNFRRNCVVVAVSLT